MRSRGSIRIASHLLREEAPFWQVHRAASDTNVPPITTTRSTPPRPSASVAAALRGAPGGKSVSSRRASFLPRRNFPLSGPTRRAREKLRAEPGWWLGRIEARGSSGQVSWPGRGGISSRFPSPSPTPAQSVQPCGLWAAQAGGSSRATACVHSRSPSQRQQQAGSLLPARPGTGRLLLPARDLLTRPLPSSSSLTHALTQREEEADHAGCKHGSRRLFRAPRAAAAAAPARSSRAAALPGGRRRRGASSAVPLVSPNEPGPARLRRHPPPPLPPSRSDGLSSGEAAAAAAAPRAAAAARSSPPPAASFLLPPRFLLSPVSGGEQSSAEAAPPCTRRRGASRRPPPPFPASRLQRSARLRWTFPARRRRRRGTSPGCWLAGWLASSASSSSPACRQAGRTDSSGCAGGGLAFAPGREGRTCGVPPVALLRAGRPLLPSVGHRQRGGRRCVCRAGSTLLPACLPPSARRQWRGGSRCGGESARRTQTLARNPARRPNAPTRGAAPDRRPPVAFKWWGGAVFLLLRRFPGTNHGGRSCGASLLGISVSLTRERAEKGGEGAQWQLGNPKRGANVFSPPPPRIPL